MIISDPLSNVVWYAPCVYICLYMKKHRRRQARMPVMHIYRYIIKSILFQYLVTVRIFMLSAHPSHYSPDSQYAGRHGRGGQSLPHGPFPSILHWSTPLTATRCLDSSSHDCSPHRITIWRPTTPFSLDRFTHRRFLTHKNEAFLKLHDMFASCNGTSAP